MDEKTISSIIRRSGALGKMVSFHAEDEKTVNELETKFKNEESIESYYKAHPPKAEEESVRKILSCATRSSHVHFCHISTLEALSAIKKARMSGMHVSCEVTPHHTLLDVESAIDKGGISIMDPPLRNRTVSETLFQAVRTGEVEVVASDHAPHSVKEKVNSHWWDIPPGIPGLETTLPLFLTQVNKGRISLDRVVQVLSTEPMKLLSLDARGIEQGASGDLVLVDTKREAKIDSSKFLSKAKYSPFDGVQAIGWPVMTFVSGQLVYDDGEITSKPGSGHVLIPTQLKSTLDPR